MTINTNMNGGNTNFMQELQNMHNPENTMNLKSEDENDYASPFVPPEFAYYPGNELCSMPPSTHFASTLLNNVTCAPNTNNPIFSAPMNYTSPQATKNSYRMCRHPLIPGMPYMEQLPDTTNFPGGLNFELSLGPHTDSATKSADYTFSQLLKKLYVQKGAHCPFKLKTSQKPPQGSYIKVLPVYKGSHVLSEPVRRCSNHAENDDEGPQRYHFIRANHGNTQYCNTDGGRLYLTIPYTGPQVGAEFQTELLSFMCFNSCGHSSHSKRRIDVIFTLEHDGQVLGRQVIEVRVCACPGRDRTNEEQSSCPKAKTPTKRGISCSGRGGKKRKLSSTADDGSEFTLTTTNYKVYEILSNIQNMLEPEIPQVPTDHQQLPPIRTQSPSSNASSPSGNVFKPCMEGVDD